MGFNAKTMKREYKGWKREFLHCSPVLKPHFTLAVVGPCSISKLIGLDKKIKVLLICCWMCISTLLSVCLFSIREGQLRWLLKRNFFLSTFWFVLTSQSKNGNNFLLEQQLFKHNIHNTSLWTLAFGLRRMADIQFRDCSRYFS